MPRLRDDLDRDRAAGWLAIIIPVASTVLGLRLVTHCTRWNNDVEIANVIRAAVRRKLDCAEQRSPVA